MSKSYFSEESIEQLKGGLSPVLRGLRDLQARALSHGFASDVAREYAYQGFGRRLDTCRRCVSRVFDLIPVDLEGVPNDDARKDAELHIHAFLLAVYGALDNLALVWVKEREIIKPNGNPLNSSYIGFRPGNSIVRESLPDALQKKLAGYDGWFGQHEDYRHALAHRIAPYIPPYAVDPEKAGLEADLGRQSLEALFHGDIPKHQELEREQLALRRFLPFIQHSWGQPATPVVFHAMLLADSNTLIEIGADVLDLLAA
ncbi:hypothetical protein [Mesorhizobium sp. M0208]|uniref:hypothetical protein n=1 Tax=Mesorhizobium sp. M0208 TaxID=2956916 RepID=UPI00333CE62F